MVHTLPNINSLSDNFQNESYPLTGFCQRAKSNIEVLKEIFNQKNEKDFGYSKYLENEWVFETKEYAILLRNICFQIYKGKFLLLNIDARKNHFQKIQTVLRDAENSLKDSFERCLRKKGELIDYPEQWKHYQSPVLQVQKQFEQIIRQIEEIEQSENYLSRLDEEIASFKIAFESYIEGMHRYFRAILSKTSALHSESFNSTQSINQLNFKELKNSMKYLLDQIENKQENRQMMDLAFINQGRRNFPVSIHENSVVFKEVNIESEINYWIEKHLFPGKIECERLELLVIDKLNQTINTTQNRIDLLKNQSTEDQQFLQDLIIQSWENVKIEVNQWCNEFASIRSSLIDREDYPAAKLIFDQNRTFLRDYKGIASKQYIKRTGFQRSFAEIKARVKNLPLVKQVAEFSELKLKKKHTDVRQFIKNRNIEEIDQLSASLFLHKGFLGNSFTVYREDIFPSISDDIQKWKQGFRGGAVITGKRLSGRSTVLESLSTYLKDVPVYQLNPVSSIELKGRKCSPNYNLESALTFILRNMMAEKIIVVIDDLELWRSQEIPLYNNLKSLISVANKYYNRLYFVVSTNQKMKKRFDKFFGFTDTFTQEFKTDQLGLKEIKEVIKVRIESSLKEGIGSKLIDTHTSKEKKKLIERIAAISDYNIGACLHGWIRNHLMKIEQNTLLDEPAPQKLYSICQKNWTILCHILHLKSTEEDELLQMNGSVFLRNEASKLQYLLSYKILKRDSNGNILINEDIINDLETHFLYNSS